MLRQMRGRAGRQGKVPVGETYLCCREGDLEQVIELIQADVPEVSSCLSTENQRVQRFELARKGFLMTNADDKARAILEIISVRLANSLESINDYFQHSLLRCTRGSEFLDSHIRSSIDDLVRKGLICHDSLSGFVSTQLGKAIVASAIDPCDGLFVHQELSKALRAFVMDGEMHVLYTFTPVQDFGVGVNWRVFLKEIESLDDSGLRVLNFLNIKPTMILKLYDCGP